jgi:putative transposase
LIFLPPYSPDLNPIEQLWKRLKRETSTAFFKTGEEFLIRTTFKRLSRRIRYCKGWIKRFLHEKFKKLCR